MNITFIGSGRVASHLSVAMHNAGHNILQVFSRQISNAQTLAKVLNAEAIDNISQLKEADIFIVSINDDAIQNIVENWNFPTSLIVHTSGKAEMNVLHQASSNYGVFYPFQTFSHNRSVDMHQVPILLEANNESNMEVLIQLALSIGKQIYHINSQQRLWYHLTAVITNNFTNHLYTMAYSLLEDQELNHALLQPLILETTNKALHLMPQNAQSGPAIRNDKNTMNKHLDLLNEYPEIKSIYRLLSASISNTYNDK